MKIRKIGILRESKVPTDSRVPLNPQQCARMVKEFPVQIVVQPSPIRCFKDEAYQKAGLILQEDLSDCDVLLGIKEVAVDQLIPKKIYCFFSHTVKKQVYNRPLLLALLQKQIKLIDFEMLKYPNGNRVIAFGYFAGMVGAHNALWTYAQRTGAFSLRRMKDYPDYAAAKNGYASLQIPPIKIVITGTGRVGQGATQTLSDMSIRQVSPASFLQESFGLPVFTKLEPKYYVKRKDNQPTYKQDFYNDPHLFQSNFLSFTQISDILINGIYWKNGAPAFFTREEMLREDFNIKVIADISCDIFPDGAVPSTLRATIIKDPVYGYDPYLQKEIAPYQEKGIDMMTIDNLPSELPVDASTSFGEQLIKEVIPELLKSKSPMIERATVTNNGDLGRHYSYLEDFVEGE